ncbi:glycosyltransferase family 39 protein [Cardiobacterium sp. AH-315-I02]|nr:glycosyltransferase family 39 protein [Cardiobacterium sp. AH-315-I02]
MDSALQNNILNFIKNYKIPLIVLLLTIVAAIPRLYNLGDPGFYMDEDITSFATRSMVETGSPQMPSGMPYYRALPHTWLNSISANIFGLDNEISYRIPGALLGILTIPLIFLLVRAFTGTSIAFLVALLLALSEWHIITSRQARMYAPFLFFYIASSFIILRWAKKDTLWNLLASIILFFIAASLHQMGVFLALIPLIALFIKDYATTPQYKLFTFAILAGAITYLYGEMFVLPPYTQWQAAQGILTTNITDRTSLLQPLSATGLQFAQATVGLLLGVWLAIKSTFTDNANGKEFRLLARYSLAILVAGFAATGHFHGAFLSILLLLLLYPEPLNHYLKATWKPLLVIATIATATAVITITENGIIPGIKALLWFPYPNWFTLFALFQGITLLFLAAMVYIVAIKKTSLNLEIRALLLLSLFPLILVGIFVKWAPARYLLQAYPFILIIVTYALYTSAHKLFQNRYANAEKPAFIFACLIIFSGVLGGHGLLSSYKVATVDYGDRLNKQALIFPFYPDHKTPGEYVAAHRQDSDIVIAEDVQQQTWYAGSTDYWLRQYKDDTGNSFMFKKQDQKMYDIYTNSVTATVEILNALTSDKSRRIWLITSGETYYERDFYLREDQRQWLEDIETTHTPVYTGKDNITQVYCLNCEAVN